MQLNLKKSFPYLGGFLGAVLLATAAFVGGMWYKGQLTPQPQSQTEQEACEDCIKPLPAPDASNWKTYRNEELGFEVKYPETAEIVEPEPLAGCTNLFWAMSSLDKELFIICRTQDLSSKDYVWWRDLSLQPERFTPHTISGLQGKRRVDPVGDLSRGPDALDYGLLEYGVDYKGDFWTITFHHTSPELFINWADTVVSTFRFID